MNDNSELVRARARELLEGLSPRLEEAKIRISIPDRGEVRSVGGVYYIESVMEVPVAP